MQNDIHSSLPISNSTYIQMSKFIQMHECLHSQRVFKANNIKNSRGSSSTTRQRHQEAVCSMTVSLACNCCVMCLPHHLLSQSWIFSMKTEARLWVGFHLLCLDKGTLRQELPQCFLCPPHEQAISDPPRSHQRPHIKIPALFRQKR